MPKIESCTGYRTEERFFPTLAEAQKAALEDLFPDKKDLPYGPWMSDSIAEAILTNQDQIIEILFALRDLPKELRPRNRKPRKDAGVKRGPRAKPAAPSINDKPYEKQRAD